MNNIEHLYYALGELCYAIAKASGALPMQEKGKLHAILVNEFKDQRADFDTTEIIFQLLQKEGMGSAAAFEWAINEIKLNSQYVSERLKQHFVAVIKKVADTYPPINEEEKQLIAKFILELSNIHGDPVFSHLTEDK